MNFSITETGHGDMLLRAMKTQEPFTELVIFPLCKKYSQMSGCKLQIVDSQPAQVIPTEESQKSSCKQRSNLNFTKIALPKPADNLLYLTHLQGLLAIQWFGWDPPTSFCYLLDQWVIAQL